MTIVYADAFDTYGAGLQSLRRGGGRSERRSAAFLVREIRREAGKTRLFGEEDEEVTEESGFEFLLDGEMRLGHPRFYSVSPFDKPPKRRRRRTDKPSTARGMPPPGVTLFCYDDRSFGSQAPSFCRGAHVRIFG